MAFVVETGAGVANANSLATVVQADQYWSDRASDGGLWSTFDEDVKERQLILATDYMRNTKRYDWSGQRKSWDQRVPWPRTGAYERNVGAIPDNVIPPAVVEAVCYLALGATSPTALQPDQERGNAIASESVGSLSVSYRPDAPPETVIVVVDGMLEALTKRRRLPIPPTYKPPMSVDNMFGDLGRG